MTDADERLVRDVWEISKRKDVMDAVIALVERERAAARQEGYEEGLRASAEAKD